MSDTLFDISPTEDQATRRKGRRQPPAPPPSPAPAANVRTQNGVVTEGDRFLMSLPEVPCDQCGAPADLVQVLLISGRRRWRVQCGWWCLHTWLIDPIPGLLEQKTEKRGFVMREGRFAGKTFDEAWAEGGEWYIRELASLSKNKRLAKEATEYLATKIA